MQFLRMLLSRIAAKIITKYKPRIIAVTGSAGKTSTKEAIFAVLQGSLSVQATPKSYNNELGLPLSVIGSKTAGKNIFGWIGIFLKGWSFLLFTKEYPKVLVLEMGADHRGDLEKLVKLAPPSISVITSVGEAHIGYYGSVGSIAEEKSTLVKALPEDGVAILNADDYMVYAMRGVARGRVLTYGFSETADVHATNVTYLHENDMKVISGLLVEAAVGKERVTYALNGVLGTGHVLASLAALATAKALSIPAAEAVKSLASYAPPPSRMHIVPGVRNTTIIDDSYNSSPAALEAALKVAADFPLEAGAKRIALLGDMRELGGHTEAAHARAGELVAKYGFDLFVGVGEAMHEALESAKKNGMNEDRVLHMENSTSAGKFLQERIRPGDVILIKGSQNTIRLERAVKELMAEPLRAEELICRQGGEWN